MTSKKSFIIHSGKGNLILPLDTGLKPMLNSHSSGESRMSEGRDTKRTIDPNAIYSREEAAEALGVSLSTLKKLINGGYLRVSQPAGIRRIFIKGESILAMLDQTVVERRA